jgi:predicted CXXCH cytochrome family protein
MSAPIAVVSVKKQGQHLGRLDVTVEQSLFASIASLTFNNSHIPLNDELTGDPRIATLVKDYTARVNGMNKQALFKKKRETPGQVIHADYTYTGADACATCHPAQYDTWLLSAHAGAYKTLADKGSNFDTECLSCHTTGYGETGGYDVSQADASPLLSVQCESCHGPGSNHKEKGTILRTVGPEVCVSCHAEKHSPRFDYKEYVPLITCPSGH